MWQRVMTDLPKNHRASQIGAGHSSHWNIRHFSFEPTSLGLTFRGRLTLALMRLWPWSSRKHVSESSRSLTQENRILVSCDLRSLVPFTLGGWPTTCRQLVATRRPRVAKRCTPRTASEQWPAWPGHTARMAPGCCASTNDARALAQCLQVK